MIDPNEFDDVIATEATATWPRLFGRKRAAVSGLDSAKQDIADMGRTLTDIAERMQRLDDAATSPEAVRRATLEEVQAALYDANDLVGYRILMRMRNGA